MGSVGFKEWALVCEALGSGAQSILLRKGGIAEGRAGFQFQHREFFLFPTFFHEQIERVRMEGATLPAQTAGEIEIRYFARVDFATVVTEWSTAEALEPWHVLTRAVVRERFDYDDAPGIHLAFVRVYRVEPAWIFPAAARYGGCRSWVELPTFPEEVKLRAVLSDKEHEEQRARLLTLVES